MIVDIVKKIAIFLLILFILFQLSFCLVFFPSNAEFGHLSLLQAYLSYFKQLFNGQLQLNTGNGYLPLFTYIKSNLPSTIQLCIFSLLAASIIGISLGIIAGHRLHSWPNKLIHTFGFITSSCPVVWIAVLIIYNVSDHNFLLPDFVTSAKRIDLISGFSLIDVFLTSGINKTGEFLKELQYLVLPVAILSVYPSIVTVQLVSWQIDHVSRKNYITTIRIREQSQLKIIFRHMLPNVLPPILPQLTYNLSLLLFYAMLIEIIFNKPGLGTSAISAFTTKNSTVIAIILILCGVIIATLNLISDLISVVIRPLHNRDLNNE